MFPYQATIAFADNTLPTLKVPPLKGHSTWVDLTLLSFSWELTSSDDFSRLLRQIECFFVVLAHSLWRSRPLCASSGAKKVSWDISWISKSGGGSDRPRCVQHLAQIRGRTNERKGPTNQPSLRPLFFVRLSPSKNWPVPLDRIIIIFGFHRNDQSFSK